MGRCQDLTDNNNTKIFVIDLDLNGFITNRALFGRSGYDSEPREIEKIDDKYYITGYEDPIGDPKSNAILFKIDNNLNQLPFANDPWGNSTAAVRHSINSQNSIGWDVKKLNNGNIAWAFIESCIGCHSSGNNRGQGKVFIFNAAPPHSIYKNIDLQNENTYGYTQLHAFDMKLGLTATQDGGFAILGTFQPEPLDKTVEPFMTAYNYINTHITGYNCIDGVIESPFFADETFYQFANTDAWIGKFNANGDMVWDKSFDADPAPIENYPGDWKNQECVYRITEADDGSLVFVGNTSHNKDDYYIAKIESDCGVQKDLVNGYDFHSATQNTVVEITTPTTWDFSTQNKSTYSLTGTFVVKSGATLTIDGVTIEFADSRKMPYPTKLIVEPGGTLVIKNGAILTSLSDCQNTMWSGIEVWGNSTAVQTPANQGRLIMQSNAEINNAIIGVACVKRTGFTKDLTKTGGILNITNSVFRNNLISIEIRPYTNTTGNGPLNNVSYINRTDFIIDAPLNDQELASTSQVVSAQNGLRESVPRAHQEFILLDGIRGFNIKGNTFTLDDSNPYIAAIEGKWRGYGILSWDSDFKLSAYNANINPNDPPNLTPNTFNNLFYGVYCKPMGNVNDVLIDNNIFNNNHFGVAFSGAVNYAKIINNIFNVAESPMGVTLDAANAAIYSQSATGLKIEANVIKGYAQTGVGVNAGVYIESSSNGGGAAEIYKNEFDLLDVTIQSIDDNTVLNVDCNQFSKDPVEEAIIWHNTGFISDQGFCPPPAVFDPELPQANTFTGAYIGNNYTILNEGAFFQYNRYTDPQFVPTNSLSVLDFPCPISAPANFLTCPVRNAPPNGIVVGLQINNLVSEIELLEDNIDNGNTGVLIDVINTQPAYIVKNELKNVAPYLSDEVLIALINKNNMPAWVVNQVLLANQVSSTNVLMALLNSANNYPNWVIKNQIINSSPVNESVLVAAVNRTPQLQASTINSILTANSPLKDESLIQMLMSTNSQPNWVVRNVLKLNTPLSASVDQQFQANVYPNWVYNQVYNSGVIANEPNSKAPPTSAMLDLEKEITYKTNLKTRQVDYMVTYYLDSNNFEPAVLLLEAQNSVEGSCLLLPLLLETKDGVRLYEHIQKIRNKANQDPNSTNSEGLYAFCDYYELMYIIKTQAGGIEAITIDQISQLDVLSNLNNSTAINSANVMEYLELKEFDELLMRDINFGGVTKSMVVDTPTQHNELKEINKPINFILYPNPTQSNVNITYNINDLSDESILNIYDLTGKLIYTLTITDQHNNIEIPLIDFGKGIYLVNITSNKGDSVTKKLIVQ